MMPELRSNRRLTGPNVIWQHPGPVIDIALNDKDASALKEKWAHHITALLEGMGWDVELASRHFPGGLSLAFNAPMDRLYVACEMNEWAYDAAVAEINAGDKFNLEEAIEKFTQEMRREANPPLLRIQSAAAKRNEQFLTCDDYVSVGSGVGSQTWSVKDLPEAGSIDWDSVYRVPTAMVTGTNGKTTIVRLLRAMVIASGKVPGMSSTDWLMVGNKILDKGDWSGPGGARTILRDKGVEVALLETARGGMLRRGIGVLENEADVALINNVAPDHLGEWGIQDVDMLADTKFVLRHAGKTIVLNADDEHCVKRASIVTRPIVWFSLEADNELIAEHLAGGKQAIRLDADKVIRYYDGSDIQFEIAAADIPMTFGGAALHNVANAMAAIAVARKLNIADEHIASALLNFQSDTKDNPGRLNMFEINGAKVIVDFAHNPHGLTALSNMVKKMDAKRRLITIGHAGDRQESDFHEVAMCAVDSGADRILIKEQIKDLRGRELGEVPAFMKKTLLEAGISEDRIEIHQSEMDATKAALEWSEPGDVLLLLTLSERNDVLSYLQSIS
ncbi:MAG: Mur ligase [Planctomycetes bacterium]|nr:Mur ligase [Planctomycetota bacterium]